jgi:hypothetical protein
MNTAAATYEIGTKFIPVGRVARECTVIDILRTYNSANELVRVRYVATHTFAGQLITESDVCAATIARGLINQDARVMA